MLLHHAGALFYLLSACVNSNSKFEFICLEFELELELERKRNRKRKKTQKPKTQTQTQPGPKPNPQPSWPNPLPRGPSCSLSPRPSPAPTRRPTSSPRFGPARSLSFSYPACPGPAPRLRPVFPPRAACPARPTAAAQPRALSAACASLLPSLPARPHRSAVSLPRCASGTAKPMTSPRSPRPSIAGTHAQTPVPAFN